MELRQSTSQVIRIGPFLDEDDGKTAETGLTINQADIRLSKDGGAFAQSNDTGGATHDENGWYYLTLNATDTNTLASLEVAIHVSGALPVFKEYEVVTSNYYDSKYSTDKLEVDIVQIGGDTQSATDLKDFADAGYDPATNKVEGVKLVDTTTANTDMRGTDNALLAASVNVSGGIIESNLKQIEGLAVSGNNATLRLKQLHIVNNEGPGIHSESQNATSPGAYFLGETSGAGIKSEGGASGHGIHAEGFSNNGSGIYAEGVQHGLWAYATGGGTNTAGIYGQGLNGADGMRAFAASDGVGFYIEGGNDAPGLYAKGGDTGAPGILAEAQAGNADGIKAIGIGTGNGFYAIGGTGNAAHGIKGESQASGSVGHGIQGISSNGYGVHASGTLAGLYGVASGGRGAHFVGGGSNAGVRIEAPGNAHGLECITSNSTKAGIYAGGGLYGIYALSTAAGTGLYAEGAGNSGHGAHFKSGAGTEGSGLRTESLATSSGHGHYSTGGGIGAGLYCVGGDTGAGGFFKGGDTSGDGLKLEDQTGLYPLRLVNTDGDDYLEQIYSKQAGRFQMDNSGGGGEIKEKYFQYDLSTQNITRTVVKPDGSDNDETLDAAAMAGRN